MSFYMDATTYRSFCVGAATQRLPAATIFPGQFSKLTTYRAAFRGDPATRPPPDSYDQFRNPLAGPDGTYVPPEFYPPRYPVDTYVIEDNIVNREDTYHLKPAERTKFTAAALTSIDRARADVNRTVYQVEIGHLEDGYTSTKSLDRASKALAKTTVITPEIWDIPLSTQRMHFRDPVSVSPEGCDLRTVRAGKKTNEFGPFAIFQRVKNGVTGESEYQGVHGHLGACIANVRRRTNVERNIAPQLEDYLLEHAACEILLPKHQDRDIRAEGDKGYSFES